MKEFAKVINILESALREKNEHHQKYGIDDFTDLEKEEINKAILILKK